MIVTRKHHVPWMWIVVSQIPFATWMFTLQINGTAILSTAKKFVDNPAALTFLLSVGTIPGLIINPVVNYISDRIWTRQGRRKPFMIIPTILQGLSLIVMPLAPNLAVLMVALLVWQTAASVGGTFWSLSNEITPPSQRGMGSAIHSFMFYIGILVFYWIMIGRFDDVYFMGPIATFLGSLDGQKLTFWICAPLVIFTSFLFALGVKEILPPKRQTMYSEQGKLVGPIEFIGQFFKDVFAPQWLILYLLTFSTSLYGVTLGSLTMLLYTEQWGYTKAEFGMNVAIGAVIMLPFTFLTGWICDRFSKMRVYQTTIFANICITIAYIFFVRLVLPDHRPLLWQIILFGEIGAIIGTISGTVTWPLTFEYVPRNKMGTANAGMGLMGGVFVFILGNLAGIWVTGYSELFCPRPGSKAQIVLNESVDAAWLRSVLVQSNDFSSKAEKLTLEPFFYPGKGGKESREWIIRDYEPSDGRKGQLRKKLDLECTGLQSAIDKDQFKKKTPNAAKVQRLAAIQKEIAAIDSELSVHADAFRGQIEHALAGKLVAEGSQVQGARWEQAMVVTIPSSRRVNLSQISALDFQLKNADSLIIEVHHQQVFKDSGIISAEGPQGVAVVVRSAADNSSRAAALQQLRTAIASVAHQNEASAKKKADKEVIADAREIAGLLKLDSIAIIKTSPLLRLTLATLQSPNGDQARTMGRSLRKPGVRGARIDTLAGGIIVSAAFHQLTTATDSAPALPALVAAALAPVSSGLPDSAQRRAAAAGLYDESVKNGAGDYLTIVHPIVSSNFAPQKYDYFSGYYLMLIGNFFALLITFFIIFMEKKGVVRKLGLEEDAEQTTATEKAPS